MYLDAWIFKFAAHVILKCGIFFLLLFACLGAHVFAAGGGLSYLGYSFLGCQTLLSRYAWRYCCLFLFKLGPYLIMSPGKKLNFHDCILESHEINDFKWCSYKLAVPWLLGGKVMLICTDHPLWVYTNTSYL